MFGTQRKQGGGYLLAGFSVVLALWVATAGMMLKAYYDGNSAPAQCQVVCNGNPRALGHG